MAGARDGLEGDAGQLPPRVGTAAALGRDRAPQAPPSLTHEDLLLYRRFLADPQPAERWIMGARKLARSHPDWRPFSGPLSSASIKQALVVLNGLLSWLVQAGYIIGNPLALSRQRQPRMAPRVTRYLEQDLWQAVKATIEAMPRETARQKTHYQRVRWLFSLLYLCGLRISEIADNTMGSIFCRQDATGEERWWLEITGKGSKIRLIPATTELMAELIRYRRTLGLSPLPSLGETTPLLAPMIGPAIPLTRGAIHLVVKQVFRNAADHVRQQNSQHESLAARLERASAHWMRHTAGSAMANGEVDLRHVRDNLGHESLATTSIYLHVDEDRRHQDTDGKHRVNWNDGVRTED